MNPLPVSRKLTVKLFFFSLILLLLPGLPCLLRAEAVAASVSGALISADTGAYTITKVRAAQCDGEPIIVASSYEGAVLAVKYDGTILWTNELSGFMNHDLWCGDITGDGTDEVLAANADGSIYCLDGAGTLRWTFKPDDAPMNAVCVIHADKKPYVVCGGYDKNIYYLSPGGKLVKMIASSTYSKEKTWGKGEQRIPESGQHVANFLRPVRLKNGEEDLAVHAANNSNSGSGSVYLFRPLEGLPYKQLKIASGGSVGEMRAVDVNHDGTDELLLGSSGMIQEASMVQVDFTDDKQASFDLFTLRKKIDGFGYRVVQPEMVLDGGKERCLLLFGSRLILLPPDLDMGGAEVLSCRYSFNDMWSDPKRNMIILASAQSGGSCIHFLDLANPGWKEAYAQLAPSGKIAAILENTSAARKQLEAFRRPAWERDPLPVYLMSESTASVEALVANLKTNYASPVFLNGFYTGKAENWDRSAMANDFYKNMRDQRRNYTLTQNDALKLILPHYENEPGVAYWGGHGNDPYMFSLETEKKVIAGASGKKTVLIFPELENYDDDFAFVMNDLFYPLAKYSQGKNANIYVRTKHAFWQSIVYLPLWSRLLSGEFADVFVPSMEETTDKSMELSLAGRMGVWASGAVDQWGARCVPDNASYNRLRQFSHQKLPNHFLRAMVYSISSGAQYIDNHPVDQNYMSLLWELLAKGALYVPKRSEIVSFSPVHLGMTRPDARYLDEGNNAKWITFYHEKSERENAMVFSRLNGTWPGAPVTEWDFSRYAAGVKERRLNFLPPYESGLVLITPPQTGVCADTNAPRGKLADHLHPLYRNIMKEYITDGRNYYSADGKQTYKADEYYRVIEANIKAGTEKLPLIVSGNVAWVCAQTAPTHLRLTLVDSGYINPGDKTAVITFHTVRPVAITDIMTGERIPIANGKTARVPVPCGLFLFLDVELENAL